MTVPTDIRISEGEPCVFVNICLHVLDGPVVCVVYVKLNIHVYTFVCTAVGRQMWKNVQVVSLT